MDDALTEQRFEVLADETLRKLFNALADTEDDGLDVDLESGVMTLAFDNGTKFVVNSHRAARQIWMAAGATAWHFDLQDGRWISAKNGDELWSTVQARVSAALARPVELHP